MFNTRFIRQYSLVYVSAWLVLCLVPDANALRISCACSCLLVSVISYPVFVFQQVSSVFSNTISGVALLKLCLFCAAHALIRYLSTFCFSVCFERSRKLLFLWPLIWRTYSILFIYRIIRALIIQIKVQYSIIVSYRRNLRWSTKKLWVEFKEIILVYIKQDALIIKSSSR